LKPLNSSPPTSLSPVDVYGACIVAAMGFYGIPRGYNRGLLAESN
jgi:hypothetical protein